MDPSKTGAAPRGSYPPVPARRASVRAVKTRTFIVPEELSGERLDVVLARLAPDLSRRQVRRMVDAGSVFLDGRRSQVCSRSVRAGTAIEVALAPPRAEVPPVSILALDDDLAVIDKPARMPAEPTREGSAGSALRALADQLRAQGASHEGLRAAHRIDVDTTGVLVFARNAHAAQALHAQFAAQQVARRYLAHVTGQPDWTRQRIDLPLSRQRDEAGRVNVDPQGAPCTTLAVVLARGEGGALLACAPVTGRMHQLRAHLAAVGHALAGDRRYGGAALPHLGLHALLVKLVPPAAWASGARGARASFVAPPPPAFVATASALGVFPEAVEAAARSLAEPRRTVAQDAPPAAPAEP